MREFITQKDIGLKPLELSEADEKRVDGVIEKVLSLDASGLATLRERIRENGGLIRVFVHPFDSYKPRIGQRNEARSRAYDFVEEGATRHISSASDQRSAPVFLLEEESFLEDARQKVQENIHGVAAGIFIIPTSAESGYIDSRVSLQALSGSDWYTKATAEAQNLEVPASDHLMAILLRGLGVKKIIVGGMYVRDDPEVLVGCVGTIIKVAKEQGITVSLSKYHTDWTGENARGVQQPM